MLTQICCLFLDIPLPSTIFIHPFPPPKTLNAQIQEDWRAKIAKIRKRLNFWSLCTYMKNIRDKRKNPWQVFFISYCRQLSADIKIKIIRLKPVLLALAFVAEYWTNTTGIIFILIFWGKYMKYDAKRVSVWLKNRLIFARLEPWDWQNF